MRIVLVELDDGTQEFFDTLHEAFQYAKNQEKTRRNSVECVIVGGAPEDKFMCYAGQELRLLLRSLDNISVWLKASRQTYESEEL